MLDLVGFEAALKNPEKFHGLGPYDVATGATTPAKPDAEAAIRFVTTGAFRPLGEAREFRVTPNNYGRWAFVLANAGRLDDPNDAALLQAIAQARFRDPAADVAPLAAKLGPQGRAVHEHALAGGGAPEPGGRSLRSMLR